MMSPSEAGRVRDPVEILRRWPHSPHLVEHGSEVARYPPPINQHLIDDKIVLARLALDLYREIDELPNIEPEPSAAPCTDPRCTARINSLCGALIEACLLTQRILMMPETTREDIDKRVRELMELIER